jgi:hypothetical protein
MIVSSEHENDLAAKAAKNAKKFEKQINYRKGTAPDICVSESSSVDSFLYFFAFLGALGGLGGKITSCRRPACALP